MRQGGTTRSNIGVEAMALKDRRTRQAQTQTGQARTRHKPAGIEQHYGKIGIAAVAASVRYADSPGSSRRKSEAAVPRPRRKAVNKQLSRG